MAHSSLIRDGLTKRNNIMTLTTLEERLWRSVPLLIAFLSLIVSWRSCVRSDETSAIQNRPQLVVEADADPKSGKFVTIVTNDNMLIMMNVYKITNVGRSTARNVTPLTKSRVKIGKEVFISDEKTKYGVRDGAASAFDIAPTETHRWFNATGLLNFTSFIQKGHNY